MFNLLLLLAVDQTIVQGGEVVFQRQQQEQRHTELYKKTLGLLGIGWLIELFLMPSLEREAEHRYRVGPIDYTLAWICLTFFGLFGLHRFYLGKWPTAILYLLTAGLLGVGILYDFWTLNEQVDEANA